MTVQIARELPRTLPTEESRLGTLGLATVLIGPMLSIVDFFIVNVALPTIDADLHASSATLELVVAGYGIAYALLLVVGGRLGDAMGRRRLFLTGMAAFTVASLACGLAPSAGTLVAARIAQGASAALMVPQVLATIQATLTGHQRSRAIGLYGATAGIAAAVGQLVGGGLISADIAGTGWRPIFLVNVPIGVVGLLLAGRALPDTRSGNPASVDRPGTALLGVTLLALLIPLTEGRSLGWPPWTWLVLALVPFAAAAFTAVERRGERAGRVPLVPPSLVRLRGMRSGLLLALPFFTGFGAFMFVFAVTVQDGLGMGPLESGVALTPMGLAFLAGSLATTPLLERHGRRVITTGALLQAVGLAALVLAVMAGWPAVTALDLAPGMVVAGFGQGLVASPLFRVVLSEVPAERAGVGTGVLVTTQQSALALGVATLGSLFLSLASGPGMRDAFVIVVLIQAALAVLVAATSRRLP